MNWDLWEEFVDRQARAFCKHAESNPRVKELVSRDYDSLSEAEQNELFFLLDVAELSFKDGEGEDWWR